MKYRADAATHQTERFTAPTKGGIMRLSRVLAPMIVAGIGVVALGIAQPVSAQNRIYARALPAFNDWSTNPVNSPWDHTYVCVERGAPNTCTNPSTPVCFALAGRTSGGPELYGSSGYGSGKAAICRGTNARCAFRYGVDGTCHQYSNRALSVSNTTVSQAWGYGLSVGLFGTYGRQGWSDCQAACPTAMCYR